MLLSVFLFAGAVLVVDVPADLSLAASALFIALLLRLWLGHRLWFLFLRLILFVAVAFAAYLLEFYPPTGWDLFSQCLSLVSWRTGSCSGSGSAVF